MSEGFKKPRKIVKTPDEADTLLVIDVSNLAFRSTYAYSDLTTSTGLPSGHVYGSVSLLLATVRNQIESGNVCFVFCYEGTGAAAKRRETLPEYKANRDYAERFNPIPDVREALACIPGVHIAVEGKEGDDGIAWAVRNWPNKHCVVLSGDKDLWALLQYSNVQVYSPNLKDFVTAEHIAKYYGTEDPRKIPLHKALYGDTSDGIKGLDRLNKKQVEPVLNAPGVVDVQTFYNAVAGIPGQGLKGKTLDKIEYGRAVLDRNMAVILPDVLGFDFEKIYVLDGDEEALRAILTTYECNDLLTRIDPLFGVSVW